MNYILQASFVYVEFRYTLIAGGASACSDDIQVISIIFLLGAEHAEGQRQMNKENMTLMAMDSIRSMVLKVNRVNNISCKNLLRNPSQII